MIIHTATNLQQAQKAAIEGPTKAQARKMATRRVELLAQAQDALAAGNDDLAFNCDCDAFDIEADLVRYGFDLAGEAVR